MQPRPPPTPEAAPPYSWMGRGGRFRRPLGTPAIRALAVGLALLVLVGNVGGALLLALLLAALAAPADETAAAPPPGGQRGR